MSSSSITVRCCIESNGTILRDERPAFAERARRGEVSPETIVFNNTLTRVADVQNGRWEVPARESWHRRAFFSTSEAGPRTHKHVGGASR